MTPVDRIGVDDDRLLAVERRQFGKVMFAQVTSTLGSQFALVATPLAAYVLTGSAAAAGLVGVCNALARTVTATVGGAVADRLDQRTVMIVCDVGRLLATLVLFWVVFTEATRSVAVLCVLVAVEGILSTIFTPAESVLVCRIVAKQRLPARLARTESGTWGAALIGPPIGGLLFSINPALPFLGNALSYLISALALVLVDTKGGALQPVETDPGESGRKVPRPGELVAGLRYVVKDRFLRPVVLQVALHNVALGALSIIVLVGAEQRGVSGLAIGCIVGAQALGALVGSFCAMPVLRRVSGGLVVLCTGWTWVALIPLIVAVRHWLLLSLLLALLWVLAPIQRTVIATYQGQRVPRALLGRVTSAVALLAGGLAAIGPGIGGQLLSTQNVLLTAGCLTAITLPPLVLSTFVAGVGRVTIDLDRRVS